MKWRAFYSLNGEEKAAVYLKDLLSDLGPAFVKIGQAVSSRPDVVPPVYIKQLEFLQVRGYPCRLCCSFSIQVRHHLRNRQQPITLCTTHLT